MRAHGSQWISHKVNIRHPQQLKKWKSWDPFLSYQLNTKQHYQSSPFTSKLGQIGQIGSAVYLVAPKWLPGFWFFQLQWVPIIHLRRKTLRSGHPQYSSIATVYLPTSSFPRSYWMPPKVYILASCGELRNDKCRSKAFHVQPWNPDNLYGTFKSSTLHSASLSLFFLYCNSLVTKNSLLKPL